MKFKTLLTTIMNLANKNLQKQLQKRRMLDLLSIYNFKSDLLFNFHKFWNFKKLKFSQQNQEQHLLFSFSAFFFLFFTWWSLIPPLLGLVTSPASNLAMISNAREWKAKVMLRDSLAEVSINLQLNSFAIYLPSSKETVL